jgi:hypothetical protein
MRADVDLGRGHLEWPSLEDPGDFFERTAVTLATGLD